MRRKTGFICALIASCALCFHYGTQNGMSRAQSHIYPRCGIVTELNHEDDTVTVTDGAGMLWEFYGCEDWERGDFVAMLMNDNGTPDNIRDDKIVDVRYGGIFN